MPAEITGRRRPTKVKKQGRGEKRKREDVSVERLQQAVADLDVKSAFKKFADLPLSEPTQSGLRASNFTKLSSIQAQAIAPALKGHDILGAAKTGSGKTLAFLVPVLENLYRQQCVGPHAGLGAMIISPTRELAVQIFDVLFKIGKHGHLFAAGLVSGGKSLEEEQQALARMNIVVCTPGRMLQHLSQTAAFSVDNLSMLVLDEADRIMDLGFQKDVDAIVEYLPPSPQRQTLLFSATQSRKVSDLARLSLKDPEYISVHESAETATPTSLQQNYCVVALPEKLDTLWSFLQAEKKKKLLVFLSSGKQVRFVYESFRKMQPGIPLLHLHGKQKHGARLQITQRFAQAKYSCLFATDVAARGLDFPAVDWVVQVDCPEDADTYIHRVGRTARYDRDGQSLLFLDPLEEEGMLRRLKGKNVPIQKQNIKARSQRSVKEILTGLCFRDPELKYIAQKAFATYARALYVQKDKEVFQNLQSYDLEGFASALGLPGAPRIKFLKGDEEARKNKKNASRQLKDEESSDAEEGEKEGGRKPAVRTRYDRMFDRQNQGVLTSHYQRMIGEDSTNIDESRAEQDGDVIGGMGVDGEEDDGDGLFTVKSRHIPEPDESEPRLPLHKSNRLQRALLSRKKAAKILGSKPTKMVFDEDTGLMKPAAKDEPITDRERLLEEGADVARQAFTEAESRKLLAVDANDKFVAKEKRKAKRDKRAKKARDVEREDEDDAYDEEEGPDFRLEVQERPFEDIADLYDSESGMKDNKAPDNDAAQTRSAIIHKRRKKGNDKQAGVSQPLELNTLEDLEAAAAGLLD